MLGRQDAGQLGIDKIFHPGPRSLNDCAVEDQRHIVSITGGENGADVDFAASTGGNQRLERFRVFADGVQHTRVCPDGNLTNPEPPHALRDDRFDHQPGRVRFVLIQVAEVAFPDLSLQGNLRIDWVVGGSIAVTHAHFYQFDRLA